MRVILVHAATGLKLNHDLMYGSAYRVVGAYATMGPDPEQNGLMQPCLIVQVDPSQNAPHQTNPSVFQ